MNKLLFFASLVALVRTQDDTTIANNFLTQIQVTVSPDRIANYLVDVIYDRSTEKEITTEEVLDLYLTNTINLELTRTILEALEIEESDVFSLNGLNNALVALNFTFRQWWNTLVPTFGFTEDLVPPAVYEALEIDPVEFNVAMATLTMNPWEVFIGGVFTQETIEAACAAADTTVETLWANIRNVFIDRVTPYEIQDFLQLLLSHKIEKEQAVTIWNTIPITQEHVITLPIFNELLSELSGRVTVTALGAIIGPQQIVIHRNSHEVFREDLQYLAIYAQPLQTGILVSVEEILDTVYQNQVVLSHASEDTLTVIDVAAVNSDLINCTYITYLQNEVVRFPVESATFSAGSYSLPLVTQNVIPGSALVCNNVLYGIAREIVDDNLIVDAFSVYVGAGYSIKSSASAIFGLLLVLFTRQYI